MGIIFLLVYQIGSICGLFQDCCGLLYAVFIQTLALMCVQPILLFSISLRKNLKLELVIPFIILQFVGTPLGQLLQELTPVPILKIVIGTLTILVALKQIHGLWNRKKCTSVYFIIGKDTSNCNWLQDLICQHFPDISGPPTSHLLGSFFPILKNYGDLENDGNFAKLVQDVCQFLEKVDWKNKEGQDIFLDENEVISKCHQKTFMAVFEAVMDIYTMAQDRQTWISRSLGAENYHLQLIEHFGERLNYIYLQEDIEKDFQSSIQNESQTVFQINYESLLQNANKMMRQFANYFDLHVTIEEEKGFLSHFWPVQPKMICIVLTGFFYGFLAGLVGIGGPPLILFFLVFEQPNAVVQANGIVIAAVNTTIRILTYILKAPPEDYTTKSWFLKEDLSLYLAVALSGIVAANLGTKLSNYMKKSVFKFALVTLLIINGLTMIVTVIVDLH